MYDEEKKKSISLIGRLRECEENNKGSSFACNVQNKIGCECCGRGFIWKPSGPSVIAEVCKCVKECLCAGKAMYINDRGEAASCTPQSITKTVSLANAMNIPSRYAQASFAFDNKSVNQQSIALIQQWALDYEPKKNGLVIHGPVGLGKTHLLCGIAKALVTRGISVKYVDFFSLINTFTVAITANKDTSTLWDSFLACDVLVIDELGKGKLTAFEVATIDQIISLRYNEGKTILAATNAKLSRAPRLQDQMLDGKLHSDPFSDFGYLPNRIGERAYSRLSEMCVFHSLSGQDYRQELAKKFK